MPVKNPVNSLKKYKITQDRASKFISKRYNLDRFKDVLRAKLDLQLNDLISRPKQALAPQRNQVSSITTLSKKVKLIGDQYFLFQTLIEGELIIIKLKNVESKSNFQLRMQRQIANRIVSSLCEGDIDKLADIVKINKDNKPFLDVGQEYLRPKAKKQQSKKQYSLPKLDSRSQSRISDDQRVTKSREERLAPINPPAQTQSLRPLQRIKQVFKDDEELQEYRGQHEQQPRKVGPQGLMRDLIQKELHKRRQH